jgi:hypothetical protein
MAQPIVPPRDLDGPVLSLGFPHRPNIVLAGFDLRVQFAPKPFAFELGIVQTLLELADFALPTSLQFFALIPSHIALAAHLFEHLIHFPQSGQ